MKKGILYLAALAICFTFVGCDSGSPADKVKAKADQKYQLTAEEALKAENSAKTFFSKTFPAGGTETKQGMFQECRPSDSNFNGLVTCMGYVPNIKSGQMELITRYCNYRADMVLGCSNEDK